MSGILNTENTMFQKMDVSLLKRDGDTYSVGSLRKRYPHSLDNPCHITTAI
jgi:hypothetical protein